jgi:hypothetical protein
MTLTWGDDFAVPDEVIPACGVRRTSSYDPRDPQVTIHTRHDGRKTSVKVEGDAVVIYCYENSPMPESELKYLLAAARKEGVVRSLTMLLDKNVAAEHYAWLVSRGFDRDYSRETRNDPSLAFTKFYKVKIKEGQ